MITVPFAVFTPCCQVNTLVELKIENDKQIQDGVYFECTCGNCHGEFRVDIRLSAGVMEKYPLQ